MRLAKPPIIQHAIYKRGAVCAVATLRTDPVKERPPRERQSWRLDRVTEVGTWPGSDERAILAVESGAPIEPARRRPSARRTVALSIGGYLGLGFHARECWEAWIAEGRPEWPDGKAAREWVRQYLRRIEP